MVRSISLAMVVKGCLAVTSSPNSRALSSTILATFIRLMFSISAVISATQSSVWFPCRALPFRRPHRLLKDAFPGIKFEVHGTPKDFAGAEDLSLRDKYQFQWWAVTLINAVPYGGKKKGADTGIDGYYYCKPDGKKMEAGIVSVKAGETLHRDM